MASHSFLSPPPAVPDVLVSFPAPHVLLVTFNRPRQLNSLPSTHHAPLDALFRWFDNEPSLRCAVVTGSGRAFCAGADLKEWNSRHNAAVTGTAAGEAPPAKTERWTPSGFGGLSNRTGKKPVVAAVNGICLGGGMEMAVNCDLVVAAQAAQFGLPEVKRGVVAIAGALPRVVRTLGRQRAAEMALTGRMFTAAEMERWGIVNKVVASGDEAVAEAVKMASAVAGNSPDAVVVSREGMRMGWEGIAPELATDLLERGMYGTMDGAENMKEGVLSFVERREAVWKNSKL